MSNIFEKYGNVSFDITRHICHNLLGPLHATLLSPSHVSQRWTSQKTLFFMTIDAECGQTRKHCFLTMFPVGKQTKKHCFLAMFSEGGETRKHCFVAMFSEG